MPLIIQLTNHREVKNIKPIKPLLMISLIVTLLLSLLPVTMVHAQDADKRIAIPVSEQQKAVLLSEMRELLEASQKILEGVVNDDLEQVETSARKMGLNAARSVPPGIAKLLPSGFKALGPQVHKGYERIADEAEGFGDKDKILKILSKTQKVCTECHAIYKF